ncbi:DUF4838 domain-containing protein [Pontiella agarivorans]|uniref:DUF4838 domain-containing protein n=1 Tax=Pontiella agarivorans TaxID=3038953 RepID=A0ABU5MS51_9BACT|nr:DUF4838 domain-containing protein [Pontiella agarivorans]MDZ8117021.1 DUF4838 domain-containing protein [Pontiella agarivorans]
MQLNLKKRNLLIFSALLLGSGIAAANQIEMHLKCPAPPQEQVLWDDADSSDDTACTVAFAASELQYYLRLITGETSNWAIVNDEPGDDQKQIVFTQLDSSDTSELLGDEGYILVTKNTQAGWRAEIKFAHRIGALYGAYDLLHRLGVRWFAPGEAGQIVPQSKLETIPEVNAVERPDYLLRGFHAWEDRGGTDFLLWMARNRLNYWCIEESNKPLINKLGIQLAGGEHLLHDWYLGAFNAYPYNHSGFDGDEQLPADPYQVSPSFLGDKNADGRLSYYEAHPEWFGLNKGKRVPGPNSPTGKGRRHGVNFCTSNADALAEFVKNAVTDFESGRLKDASIVNAWLLDNATWCSCEECRKLGTPTDRNLLVIYAMDQGVKTAQKEGRIHRPIRFLFLTYNDVIDPPTRPLPADFDYESCIATFFPIRRCYVHDLQDTSCDINTRFDEIFRGWVSSPDRFYKGQMCVGEYYNISRFKCLPMSFMNTMTPDIPYYHKLGARYFHYMHVSTENWGNKALTNWQMARQLWDVDSDVEALWTDYFSARYESAADDMRNFYEGLEPMLSNITLLKYTTGPAMEKGGRNAFSAGSHLSYDQPGVAPSLLEMREAGYRCRELIDRVQAQELTEPVRRRIEEDERMFVYGERTLEFYDLAEQGFRAVREKNKPEAERILKRLKVVEKQLKDDTVSASNAGEHASSPNALDATYGRRAVKTLERKMKVFDEG